MLEVRGIETYYGNIPALREVPSTSPKGESSPSSGRTGGKDHADENDRRVLRPRSGTVSSSARRSPVFPHKIVGRGVALVPEGRRFFPV